MNKTETRFRAIQAFLYAGHPNWFSVKEIWEAMDIDRQAIREILKNYDNPSGAPECFESRVDYCRWRHPVVWRLKQESGL